MNPNDFDTLILQQIKDKISTFDYSRVRCAYKDVCSINELINELVSKIGGLDIFDLAQSRKKKDALKIIEQQYQMHTLLKALFIFADQFISILLGEVVGEKLKSKSLNKFLTKPCEPLMSLSTLQILPAYCVVIYRNKLVAHHDVSRISSFSLSNGGSEIVLAPLPEVIRIDPSNASELQSLVEKYRATIPDLTGTLNQFIQLKLLFYNIPLGTLGTLNPDRKKINDIAEKGGCESYTSVQVIKAIDDFAQAVVNTV